jgi:hypothetical protein
MKVGHVDNVERLWITVKDIPTRIAGLTCDEYDLTYIAEMIEDVVLKELKCTAASPWHAVRELTQKEDA